MKTRLSACLSLTLVAALSACSGGGGSADSGAAPVKAASVAGPLDALQTPVSNQIIMPLANALNGTPLQGLVLCANQLVVEDALDGVDSIAGALQLSNPAAALASLATAGNVQNQLQNVVVSLQGMLVAMKGDASSCINVSAPNGTNPLSGSSLAGVGSTLEPVLAQIYTTVTGGAGGTRPQLNLTQLNTLYAQLSSAVNGAFSQLPSSVTTAPVLGGVIATVQTTVTNLGSVVAAASSGSVSNTQAALATTVNTLLKNVLFKIVPLTAIETQAGHAGAISGPLASAIDQVTALLSGSGLTTGGASGGAAALQTALTSAITGVLNPTQTNVLSQLLAPLVTALQGVGTSGSNPLSGLVTALTGFLSGSSGLLTQISTLLGGLIPGNGGTCPLPAPLNLLCTLGGL